MKKLFLISFITTILIGCGGKNNKITEEYLVGNWDCNYTFFVYDNNSKGYKEENKESFSSGLEKIDGKLFSEGKQVPFEKAFTTWKSSTKISGYDVTNDVVATKNSDNEFLITIKSDAYNNSNGEKTLRKSEMLCTRIK
ncbi:hypothetical protein RHO12_01590 [Orbus sturtevantii]|uniref:hypothetical protein n=1 Tax=Orbus sturtevantii TaxID=3074109 RepID=UPI00370DA3BD